MGVDLRSIKKQFADLVDNIQPPAVTQFVVWLDEKVSEFKVNGHMKLDVEFDAPKWIREYSRTLSVGSTLSADVSQSNITKHTNDRFLAHSRISTLAARKKTCGITGSTLAARKRTSGITGSSLAARKRTFSITGSTFSTDFSQSNSTKHIDDRSLARSLISTQAARKRTCGITGSTLAARKKTCGITGSSLYPDISLSSTTKHIDNQSLRIPMCAARKKTTGMVGFNRRFSKPAKLSDPGHKLVDDINKIVVKTEKVHDSDEYDEFKIKERREPNSEIDESSHPYGIAKRPTVSLLNNRVTPLKISLKRKTMPSSATITSKLKKDENIEVEHSADGNYTSTFDDSVLLPLPFPVKKEISDEFGVGDLPNVIKDSDISTSVQDNSSIFPETLNFSAESYKYETDMSGAVRGNLDDDFDSPVNLDNSNDQGYDHPEVYMDIAKTESNPQPGTSDAGEYEIIQSVDELVRQAFRRKSTKFPCMYCGVQYSDIREITEHVKTHLSGEDDEHNCYLCEKCTSNTDEFIQHYMEHVTDFKYKFKCDECSRRFSRSDNLRRHLRNSHKYEFAPFRVPRTGVTEIKPVDYYM